MPAMHRLSRIFPPTVAILVAAAPMPAAAAQERPRMRVDNVAEIDVKDCVRNAAEAVAAENLDAYIGCFCEKVRPKLRRQAAIVFVTHDVGLELLDSHLMGDANDTADIAVKYRATLSAESWDIVSTLGLVREDGSWRIAAEKVQARAAVGGRESGGSGGQVFRFGGGGDAVLNPPDDGLPADIGRRPGGGCANGRCGVR
jgi:hypothetical protein